MRNWAGNVVYSTEDVRHPQTVEELQQVVASAARVRAVGTGHSFSPVADTTGTLVSTRDLQVEIAVDEVSGVAVVPGGATYAEVGRALHSRGWALHNLGSLPHITVAGACSTGTHGSGFTNTSLAAAAVGIELVRADGELVSSRLGDTEFPGMVLSLGSLGVVTRVWLRVEPTYEVAQEVILGIPFGTAVDQAQEILGSAYSVSLFSSFRDPARLDSVWVKRRVDREPTPTSSPWGGRPATEPVHPLLGLDPIAATEQLGRPGPWHDRLPHFRVEFQPSAGEEIQSEFFLRRADAGVALEALSRLGPVFTEALQVFEMRTIAADDLWLSPFRGRDTVAVHATWVRDLDAVLPALAALEAALAPYEPRPHWGKLALGFDADRIAGLYPALPRFRELAERLDPQRCFTNAYVEGLGVR